MEDKQPSFFLVEEIRNQQKKVDEEMAVLKALQILSAKYSNAGGFTKTDEIGCPLEYSGKLIYKQKALFVLKSLSKGSSRDVATAWMKIDSTINEERALGKSQEHLSRLYCDNIIDARKNTKGK